MPMLELGTGQMRVMHVLWKRDTATAQEITDILNEESPTKLSTVSTFLRALVKKEAVAYEVENRTYIYRAIVDESMVKRHALQGVIDHVFDGSAGGVVSYLVENSLLSPEEMENISKLFEEKEE